MKRKQFKQLPYDTIKNNTPHDFLRTLQQVKNRDKILVSVSGNVIINVALFTPEDLMVVYGPVPPTTMSTLGVTLQGGTPKAHNLLPHVLTGLSGNRFTVQVNETRDEPEQLDNLLMRHLQNGSDCLYLVKAKAGLEGTLILEQYLLVEGTLHPRKLTIDDLYKFSWANLKDNKYYFSHHVSVSDDYVPAPQPSDFTVMEPNFERLLEGFKEHASDDELTQTQEVAVDITTSEVDSVDGLSPVVDEGKSEPKPHLTFEVAPPKEKKPKPKVVVQAAPPKVSQSQALEFEMLDVILSKLMSRNLTSGDRDQIKATVKRLLDLI